MPLIRNLPFIRSLPGFGSRLVESLQDVQKLIQNVAQQTNATPSGQETPPPPAINALSVTASGGVAHVQITDNNPIFRGTNYHVQYATDPGFSSPITAHMGPSRDIRIPVGTQPLYYRAFSDLPTSQPSAPVYNAGAVAASGTAQPPIPPGMGSGTGMPGQISGYGPIPYRTTTGTPPKRA